MPVEQNQADPLEWLASLTPERQVKVAGKPAPMIQSDLEGLSPADLQTHALRENARATLELRLLEEELLRGEDVQQLRRTVQRAHRALLLERIAVYHARARANSAAMPEGLSPEQGEQLKALVRYVARLDGARATDRFRAEELLAAMGEPLPGGGR